MRTVFRRVLVEEREALSGRELGSGTGRGGGSATERNGAHEGSHGGLSVQCVRIWGSPLEERSDAEDNCAGEERMCLQPVSETEFDRRHPLARRIVWSYV